MSLIPQISKPAIFWESLKVEKNNKNQKHCRLSNEKKMNKSLTAKLNQSRMCGKGVGLGLFPSEVEKWPFFDHCWANFGYVSHIPAIRF